MHRVLIVEDHELWRRHFSSELARAPRWQVVGESADGLEAVHKAAELKPDLILLDVGLPSLDGIQAARQMLAHNPGLRILFVSEHQSSAIAQVALATGARGYIVKSDAATDLLLAMDAIVEGKRFVSSRFAGRVFDPDTDVSVTRQMRRHEVGFYADDASLLDDCLGFAETALQAGSSLIVLFTERRRHALRERLQSRGIDVDRAIRERRYLSLDIPAVLPKFLVDGRVDDARFWDATSALIMEAATASKAQQPCVAACGECSPTLLGEGLADAAISLERLWDDVARTFDVDLFCAYAAEHVCRDNGSAVFQEICAAHSAVHMHRP